MPGFRNATDTLQALWPALRAGEARAVHQARKQTRRAQAALRIADAPKRTKRAWRDLRRAVAPLRDRDAAGEHLRAALRELGAPDSDVQAFGAQWAEARARVLAEVRLPDPPPPITRPKHWKARVREALDSDAQELRREAAEVLHADDLERWHDWRKHLKRYRYTLELLQDAPAPLLAVLDALGRLQDAEVLQALLTREGWLPKYRRRLIAREQAAGREAQVQVRALWPALEALLTAPVTAD